MSTHTDEIDVEIELNILRDDSAAATQMIRAGEPYILIRPVKDANSITVTAYQSGQPQEIAAVLALLAEAFGSTPVEVAAEPV